MYSSGAPLPANSHHCDFLQAILLLRSSSPLGEHDRGKWITLRGSLAIRASQNSDTEKCETRSKSTRAEDRIHRMPCSLLLTTALSIEKILLGLVLTYTIISLCDSIKRSIIHSLSGLVNYLRTLIVILESMSPTHHVVLAFSTPWRSNARLALQPSHTLYPALSSHRP